MAIYVIPTNEKLDDSCYNPDNLRKITNAHIHINLAELLRKSETEKIDIFVWVSDYHCNDEGMCIMFGGTNKFEQERIYSNCENDKYL